MAFHRPVLSVLAVLAVAGSYAIGQQNVAQSHASVEMLLKERESVLEEILSSVKAQQEQGNAEREDVRAAEQELLNARLEGTMSASERIRIRERQLKIALERETELQGGATAGIVTPIQRKAAKVKRISAEIALSREKASE